MRIKSTRKKAVSAGTASVDAVLEEVSALRDLFQRRLLEDKAKNKLYDELYGQLDIARDGLSGSVIAPLAAELLLVVDRIRELESAGREELDTVAEEILEILARREVRPVPDADEFDPDVHEIARTEPPTADRPEGAIVSVVRPGYRLGTKLLRPARVVLASEKGRKK